MVVVLVSVELLLEETLLQSTACPPPHFVPHNYRFTLEEHLILKGSGYLF